LKGLHLKGKEFHYEKNNAKSSNSSSIKAYLKHHQHQQLINQYKQQQQQQQQNQHELTSEELLIDTTAFNSFNSQVKLTLEQQRLIKEKFLRDRHINHFDHRNTHEESHLRFNPISHRQAQAKETVNSNGTDVETSSKASSIHSKSTNSNKVCYVPFLFILFFYVVSYSTLLNVHIQLFDSK
jgi:hypothetical protein